MFEKFKFRILLLFAVLLMFYTIPVKNIPDYVSYAFSQKKSLNINIELVNKNITSVSADPSNEVVFEVEVTNSTGQPVDKAHVITEISKGDGSLASQNLRTDKYGKALLSYYPPQASSENTKKDNSTVTIKATLSGSSRYSEKSISLIKNPVVFVHGYNAGSYAFGTMMEYLSSLGYEGHSIDYKSTEGVESSAKELSTYIQKVKSDYLSKGVQVKKVDLIAHSMGGLVARFYTCSSDYSKSGDVRKIIFISTPQKGSLWASVAAGYYNDKGIQDLIPDNTLLSKTLPSMLNKGLNPNIQVGSIIDQYDEVVTSESASLEDWKISTEIFNVGENTLTMGNLLSGNIIETANHAIILNNKKVFETLGQMLENQLPYPIIRK